MSVIAVIQARTGSSRLPGKVLKDVGNVSMLEKIISRIGRSNTVDNIVVATTDDPSDDLIENLCSQMGIAVVRGDTFDVLSRFNSVLDAFPDANIVVRITADCPFVDPELIDDSVQLLRNQNLDFVANRLPPPWKRTFPLGLDVEVCTAQALKIAHNNASEAFQREHVMPYIYRQDSQFSFEIIQLDEDLSHYRWTVDTPEDLEAVRALDQLCGDEPFGWTKVLEVAECHPWISEINSAVEHKSVSEVDTRWNV